MSNLPFTVYAALPVLLVSLVIFLLFRRQQIGGITRPRPTDLSIFFIAFLGAFEFSRYLPTWMSLLVAAFLAGRLLQGLTLSKKVPIQVGIAGLVLCGLCAVFLLFMLIQPLM